MLSKCRKYAQIYSIENVTNKHFNVASYLINYRYQLQTFRYLRKTQKMSLKI